MLVDKTENTLPCTSKENTSQRLTLWQRGMVKMMIPSFQRFLRLVILMGKLSSLKNAPC